MWINYFLLLEVPPSVSHIAHAPKWQVLRTSLTCLPSLSLYLPITERHLWRLSLHPHLFSGLAHCYLTYFLSCKYWVTFISPVYVTKPGTYRRVSLNIVSLKDCIWPGMKQDKILDKCLHLCLGMWKVSPGYCSQGRISAVPDFWVTNLHLELASQLIPLELDY